MSETLSPHLEDTIEFEFASDLEELLIIAPTQQLLSSLISAKFANDDLPALAVAATETSLKSVMDDFVTASKAATLVEEEVLDLRILQSTAGNSLFISEGTVVAVVQTTDGINSISTVNEPTVDEIETTYRAQFGRSDTYDIRTPSLTQILETLERNFTQSFRDDFESVLDSVDSIRGRPDSIHEATIMVLLAAKHEELQYDLSIWGEDIRVTSRGRVSQIKCKLEEQGFIQTEKVSSDIGRPRLRLYLTDRLAGKAADEMVEEVVHNL